MPNLLRYKSQVKLRRIKGHTKEGNLLAKYIKAYEESKITFQKVQECWGVCRAKI